MANPPRQATPRPASPGGGSTSGQRPKEGDKPTGTFFLGRYRVVDEIGIGGMASVHLARMDGPGGFQKWVAIKRIHPHLVEDDQFVDMFLDEARIAAGINHANVAQVFDLGKDENTYWIAMEYLHGEPLREVMRREEEKRGKMTPELAARICSDAAEGLHAAHELRGKNGQLLGLVHRDVTPHNLFVTYDGYTKVVDFGIAKVADRLSSTRAGTLKGKLAYMSPEQVRGAEVDRTTDIFALGVVLWELTTNQRLFRMDTDLDTLEKVQACVVPAPSSIVSDYPIELESVVMKALAKRKQDRYQTAREFSRALQNFLMRRGVFVGPEEVAAFVRDVFSDRIQKREAHLAWAAEVTSTINVHALGTNAPTVSEAGVPPSAYDHAPAHPVPDARASGPGAGAPPTNAPSPGGASPSGAPIPQSGAFPTLRGPGLPPPMPGQSSQPMQQMAAASLMDDDEDVPTTVAVRDTSEAAQAARPRPAAGVPAVAPFAQGGAPNAPPPPHGDDDFGAATVALPRSPELQQHIADADRARQQMPTSPNIPPGMMPYGQQPPFNGFGATVPLEAYMQGPPPQGFAPQGGPVPGGMMPPGMQPGMMPPGMMQPGMMPPGMMPPGMMPPGGPRLPPQSQIETALSLPRPDPAQVWLAQQQAGAAAKPLRRNTGVLVALVLLVALSVVGIGVLVYMKFLRPSGAPPMPDEAPQTAAPAPPPAPPPDTAANPAPTATATAEAPAAPATPPPLPSVPAPIATATAAPVATAKPIVPATPPAQTSAPAPAHTSAAAPSEPAATANTSSSGEDGFITVTCIPECDEVAIDGASLGPPPVLHHAAKPGQHRITVKRSGFPTKVISVMVASGQTVAQRVQMR